MKKEQIALIFKFLEQGYNSVTAFEHTKLGLDPYRNPDDRTERAFAKKVAEILRELLPGNF